MPISSSNRFALGITTGEPRGIGPEVARKALASRELKRFTSSFFVIDKGDALEKLDRAVALIKEGRIKALVTAPVSKESVGRVASGFRGHTEYLAEKFKVKRFAMMFLGRDLKVVTLTRHIPLSKVPKCLNRSVLLDTFELSRAALTRYFKIRNPRIAVCGLNPHCGEGGLIGREESRVIIPAIEAARKRDIRVDGPISADVVFYKALRHEFDLVISMYHDQGLAPFKMLELKRGVNLTLGLPFIRTSPDHGVAFDIAGRNTADPGSMIEAIKLAYRLRDKPCL